MASPQQANSKIEAFWENYWSEEDEADDLFPEEGDETGRQEMREKYQKEVYDAGMRKVGSEADWKDKFKETLNDAHRADLLQAEIDPKNFKAIERAGMATCYVQRKVNGHSRNVFHKEQIDDQANGEEVKKYHKKKLEKAKKGKGGSGTGFLMHPKHGKLGWLVITNNHVIMDKEEAKSAKVVFDYLEDNSNKGTRIFEVSNIVAKSLRTTEAKDLKTLDISVLLLKVDNNDKKANEFLEGHALEFEESARIQASTDPALLKVLNLNFLPMIAFSHPHGLAKRISIGRYPIDPKIEKYPVAHIKHNLPTFSGSSGGNLLSSFKSMEHEPLLYWRACFVHYRHGKAVAWQAIRGSLISIETAHSAGPSTGIDTNISKQYISITVKLFRVISKDQELGSRCCGNQLKHTFQCLR